MKNINIKFIGVFLLMILVLGSCKKWIDTSINDNPDAPKDVPMSSLLPTIEATMAYNTVGGNDNVRVTSMWMQYLSGVARQSQAEANYLYRDLDINNLWNYNYATTMIDLKKLLGKAETEKHYFYLGIGEVLMANTLGVSSDVWGDMPYSEAFQGLANLSPKFDTQEALYAEIKRLLDDAITNLSNPNFNGAVGGDLIYGGDAGMWLKAAHALQARYALHLSKLKTTAYADALAQIADAIGSNDEDCTFNFLTADAATNPFFQFMDQRGDMTMHKTFVDTLIGRFDPRLAAFAAPNAHGLYVGSDWGYSGDTASLPGPAYASKNSPVPFITYVECLFIQSECLFKTGDENGARVALFAGLKASLEKWGVYSDLYYNSYVANVTPLTGDRLFKEIMMEKWIALYYQIEAYNDYRRTNNVIGLVANPTPATGSPEGMIPSRFPYSTDEKAYNTNTPTVGVSIWDHGWWDKQ